VAGVLTEVVLAGNGFIVVNEEISGMETPFVFTLHEGLPRQGPGSSECTRKAFSFLSGLPARPEILDIGCGAGMQTIELARLCPGCRITAVDIHQPFLARFIKRPRHPPA